MLDQATELRQLVSRAARDQAGAKGPPPRLSAIAAAPAGAGATTIAVNLAMALAECGARVVLVDADPRRADVARCCGLPPLDRHPDACLALGNIHEQLVRGPAGVQILPGGWRCSGETPGAPRSQLRLVQQLQLLGRHAEIVLVDTGYGDPSHLGPLWQTADDLILVTLSETSAIMDAYATLKAILIPGHGTTVHAVLNRAVDLVAADQLATRLAHSCDRFLNLQVEPATVVPAADAPRDDDRPWLSRAPDSPPALACRRLADRLMLALASRPPPTEVARGPD